MALTHRSDLTGEQPRRPLVATSNGRASGRIVAYTAFGLSFAFATALVVGLV